MWTGLGGIVVAAAIGAAVVTAPGWVTAAAVVGGAFVIGAGAVWLYEEHVPQDVREAVDAGLENAWDATRDFASDAWDTMSGGVTDTWRSVSG